MFKDLSSVSTDDARNVVWRKRIYPSTRELRHDFGNSVTLPLESHCLELSETQNAILNQRKILKIDQLGIQ